MRLPVRSIFVSSIFVLLTACGAISAGFDAMVAMGEDQIRSDMEHRPDMACAMDAPIPDLLNAIESGLSENGYDVTGVSHQAQSVDTEPASVEDAGDHYILEIMNGSVYEIDGQNVVLLNYMRGPSASERTWREPPPSERDGQGSYLSQREILRDRDYYEGLMPAIATAAGEEPCM